MGFWWVVEVESFGGDGGSWGEGLVLWVGFGGVVDRAGGGLWERFDVLEVLLDGVCCWGIFGV